MWLPLTKRMWQKSDHASLGPHLWGCLAAPAFVLSEAVSCYQRSQATRLVRSTGEATQRGGKGSVTSESDSNLQMPQPNYWPQLQGRPKGNAIEPHSWPQSAHTTVEGNKTMFKQLRVVVFCSTAVDIKLATRDWMRQRTVLPAGGIKWCFTEKVKPELYLKSRN